MKIVTYTTCWAAKSKSFDIAGALDNWMTFSDEVSIAIPLSDPDDSEGMIREHADKRGYPIVITRTEHDLSSDPFAYGKTENSALQACAGDLLIQQNLDERMLVDRWRLEELHTILEKNWSVSAFWVPTIDLYGSLQNYLPPLKVKWYVHRAGLFRGACRTGIKPDGHPDYHKTSTDELLDVTGNLVPTASLIQDLSIESIREYVAAGWPITFHLGYVSFGERLDRSKWWKDFWIKATNGDSNSHPTTVEEMERRATSEAKPHGLPLWRTTNDE